MSAAKHLITLSIGFISLFSVKAYSQLSTINTDSIGTLPLSSTLGGSIIMGNGLFAIPECGTWEALPIYYTDWETVDTLKKAPIKDAVRNWVYDEEKMVVNNWQTLEYAPCGKGTPNTWQQYRVCAITGIRQIRRKVQPYEYIPKPKSAYEKAIDSLSKQ